LKSIIEWIIGELLFRPSFNIHISSIQQPPYYSKSDLPLHELKKSSQCPETLARKSSKPSGWTITTKVDSSNNTRTIHHPTNNSTNTYPHHSSNIIKVHLSSLETDSSNTKTAISRQTSMGHTLG
jgi:hypothetical protein